MKKLPVYGNIMKNWTIAKRVTFGGALLIIALITVGSLGVLALSNIGKLATARLANDAVPGINAVADLATNFLRGHTHTLKVSLSTEPARRDADLAEMVHHADEVAKQLKRYDATISAPEDRLNFDRLTALYDDYSTSRTAYTDLVRAGRLEEARTLFDTRIESVSNEIGDLLEVMVDWNAAAALSATDSIISNTHTATNQSLASAVVGLVLSIAAGWFIIRSITTTLQQTAGSLDEASTQVAAAAGQVSSGSQSLAEGASEQAASLEKTSSSLEELSSMTKRNADSASSAQQISGEARAAADAGNSDMEELRRAMDAIKSSSNDIAKIIKTIDEIAFQTNILALNAAVEAARAGEAGQGFAVVADEVRSLARRSAESAKETASKIEVAIQSGEHGVRISDKVAQSLAVIVERARKVDALVAEIAGASREQSEGIGQINSAVGQMDKVTQSNASSAEETAASAEELNAQAVTLQEAVSDLRRLVGGASDSPAQVRLAPVTPKPASGIRTKPSSAIRSKVCKPVKDHPVPVVAGDDGSFFA